MYGYGNGYGMAQQPYYSQNYNMSPYYQNQTMQNMNTQQSNMNMNAQAQIIKGRPVSDYSEVKASMIDMDGSIFVFPDISNKRIYTKQITLDGSPEYKTYALIENNDNTYRESEQNNKSYVLKEEYEKEIAELKSKINELGGWNNGNESDAILTKDVRK